MVNTKQGKMQWSETRVLEALSESLCKTTKKGEKRQLVEQINWMKTGRELPLIRQYPGVPQASRKPFTNITWGKWLKIEILKIFVKQLPVCACLSVVSFFVPLANFEHEILFYLHVWSIKRVSRMSLKTLKK